MAKHYILHEICLNKNIDQEDLLLLGQQHFVWEDLIERMTLSIKLHVGLCKSKLKPKQNQFRQLLIRKSVHHCR